MKILLAIDGSPCSESSVDEVARRPWPAGSEIKIVSVAEPPVLAVEPWASHETYYAEALKAVRHRARAAVEGAAKKLRANETKDLKVTTDTPTGPPREVILKEAEAWGADLVVVGSHGHGWWERMLLGSVSQAVSLHAPCSVEIVRCRSEHGIGTGESEKK